MLQGRCHRRGCLIDALVWTPGNLVPLESVLTRRAVVLLEGTVKRADVVLAVGYGLVVVTACWTPAASILGVSQVVGTLIIELSPGEWHLDQLEGLVLDASGWDIRHGL